MAELISVASSKQIMVWASFIDFFPISRNCTTVLFCLSYSAWAASNKRWDLPSMYLVKCILLENIKSLHWLFVKVLAVTPLLLPYYQKHLERPKNVCSYLTYTEHENVLVYFSKLFSKMNFKLIWCSYCCCHFNQYYKGIIKKITSDTQFQQLLVTVVLQVLWDCREVYQHCGSNSVKIYCILKTEVGRTVLSAFLSKISMDASIPNETLTVPLNILASIL